MFGDPSLDIKPSLLVAFQGSNVTLTCTGTLQLQSSDPCNHTNCASFLPWSHESEKLDGSNSEMFSDGELVVTNKLQLNSITSSNVGSYNCQLNYKNKSAVLSIKLLVTG